jgi:nicotinamidase/pyrazinamidase
MKSNIFFWNTDTQYDFMRNDEEYRGKLAIEGARGIEPNLERLTQFARRNNYRIVHTADVHTSEDEEISKNPDFVNTYPMHCERDTLGAEFVQASRPQEAYIVDFKENYFSPDRIKEAREIVIYKNRFDVYSGNPHTSEIVKIISPRTIVHYGVATNVCVDQAITGSLDRGLEVIAVVDAMKGLDHLTGTPLETKKVIERWQRRGARLITTEGLIEEMRRRQNA